MHSWAIGLGLGWLIVVATPAAQAKDEFILSVGQQQLISQSRKIDRIAVGNAAVVSVKTLKKDTELLVTGKHPGKTDLIIWYGRGRKAFTLHVLAEDSTLLLPSVKQFLAPLENITVRQVEKHIFIEGEVLRPADRHTIRKLSNNHPLIVDMTKMQAQAMRITVRYIQDKLHEAGYRNTTVDRGGDTIFVRGSVPSETDLKRVQDIAKQIYPDVEFKVDTNFGEGDMVVMDVKMVEIRKDALTQLGIKWQASTDMVLQGQLSTRGHSGSLGLADAVPISLRTLQTKGLARILSNPKLSCQYEVPCTFHAGGEIPIPLIGERSVKVIFKSYGIQISFVPHLAAADMLVVEIKIEFSDINFATAVEGIPGLLKNRVETTAKVRFRKSIVLSGLINHRRSKTVDKFPLLGHMPLLGELFKSRSFKRAESEFLVVLTPWSMRAGDPTNEKRIDQTMERFERAGKEMQFKLMD